MAAGFLAGLASWSILGRREKRDFAFCSDLLLWIMVSGLIGARIAYVAASFDQFRATPWEVFYLHQGGLIYYGGFLGAAAALAIFAHVRREKLLPLLDFTVTSLPLAHAMGRIGCLIHGCCYGRVTGSRLGITYPPHTAPWWGQVDAGLITRFAPRSLSVHPVQLYEALADLALYATLVVFYRRRRREGTTVALDLLSYPAVRLMSELLRGDDRVRWLGIPVAQWTSLGLLILGLAVLWKAIRRPV
jgi:phosphatidylglycerol:prolipoprotein diacylglycerol transferase